MHFYPVIQQSLYVVPRQIKRTPTEKESNKPKLLEIEIIS